ncbi:MAG: PadR family transcriptional regulator [Cyclobacteriaceae bacterium]
MKGNYLGEFEEVILLTVGILEEEAYTVKLQEALLENSNRKATLSAIHTVLHRMEKKGFLESQFGEASPERGGKRKRVFRLTQLGQNILVRTRDARQSLWSKMPELGVELKGS